jgi:hypothetical protein
MTDKPKPDDPGKADRIQREIIRKGMEKEEQEIDQEQADNPPPPIFPPQK